MLRRLRSRRSLWAALGLGLMAAPALFGGVAAAPADPQNQLPAPELNPLESPPTSELADREARLVAAQIPEIADLAPPEFQPLVIRTANKYQLEPRLLAAVITVETEWDPHAVGFHGERGLMQIMADTGAWLARLAGMAEYDLANPETSLELGALYLSILLKEHGTVERALAVYNGGPSAAAGAATNRYVQKVFRHYPRPVPTPVGLEATAA